ncbi:AAA family ATPase [Spongiactinospora sp. TRM90649]|uniref:ParA family protein n=1 Tax=Spongiactinospora sp. TRM90649 TaxID=3031114 RepID=UPI0023F7E056|nr:AAA family ATPase [Spongiactinospora sp. TRM90649]MDF5758451.1 AAA family ATPase [Spongiactinospora sp. TRM90649]
MFTLAVLNQKGGVGKPAPTLNVAGALAELGYRVLMIDLDPQGHLTEACGVAEATRPARSARPMVPGRSPRPRGSPGSAGSHPKRTPLHLP